LVPSLSPSSAPSFIPSLDPSAGPSLSPSAVPSFIPRSSPSRAPSNLPSSVPSSLPSLFPSSEPSAIPSSVPSTIPTAFPSSETSAFPSAVACLSLESSFTQNVDLGSAENFVILSKTGISTVPSSNIIGDIGVSPIAATAITGFTLTQDSSNTFWTSDQVTGIAKAADNASPTPSELGTAVLDMQAAYTDAVAFSPSDPLYVSGEIGGLTLGPGVHTFKTAVLISSDLIFSGTATDIFIIQTSASVIQAANINVFLDCGALAENIFWSVATTVSVGAGSHLEGILLVKEEVTFGTGSSLNGRIFSQTRVDLKMATITQTPFAVPSFVPSTAPSSRPSYMPSLSPSSLPSLEPSFDPSGVPSSFPSSVPSPIPSSNPSGEPSDLPSSEPSSEPSSPPSALPSLEPSFDPSGATSSF
jgi:hypothetical protein